MSWFIYRSRFLSYAYREREGETERERERGSERGDKGGSLDRE